MTESRSIPEGVREVLSLFLADPQTVDTVGGITKWRIAQHRVTTTSQQVTEAIEWLVSHPAPREGFLLEVRPSMFSLNPEHLAEARRLVGDSLLMGKATRWLDLMLLALLREHGQDVGDHPLTRSHELIESLLAKRAGVDATDNVREVAARAARELGDVLDASSADHPLAGLSRRLFLSTLEWQAVLLCLAPELDALYQLAFGVLNDDLSRRRPSWGQICRLGDPAAVRDQLAGSGGLARWRLLEQVDTWPHADEPLSLEATVVAWLLGDAAALLTDPRLQTLLRLQPWSGTGWLTSPADLDVVASVADRLRGEHDWTVLSGEDSSGWRVILEAASVRARRALARIRPSGLTQMSAADAREVTVRLARAVALSGTVPVIDAGDAGIDGGGLDGVAPIASVFRDVAVGSVVIAADLERVIGALPRSGCLVLRRGQPESTTLAAVYRTAASQSNLRISFEESERLAHAFPLSFEAIDEAIRLALLEGASPKEPWDHAALLTAACRRVASPDLPRFARRVEPVFGLDDVVLPQDRKAQLQEIVSHVQYASQVLHAWGFDAQLPYGRGVAALFSGPSGTGKSMAAQAIARALGTHTFVVDLSRVVSKYIGDSEKHIDCAFRDAQRAGAVLQIDEAEAMFGKRSEIKDAHDRYANIEVAYLLQRMEAFDGVAILTTNLRQNLDPAFVRRLRFVVEFPRPDAEAREAIWRRCLPASAPFRDDLPFAFLARRLELTGGNIRQITVRAAFLAASEQASTIELRHVIAATRSELFKLGMNSAERELAELEAASRSAGWRVA